MDGFSYIPKKPNKFLKHRSREIHIINISIIIIFVPRSNNTSNPNLLDTQSSPNQVNATPIYNNTNNTSPGNPVGVVKGIQQAKTTDPDNSVLKDVPPYR